MIAYPNTDVFLVCFSIINPDSYDNVREKWVPEIQKHWGQAPFLLVGTQMDLRTDPATITNLGEIYTMYHIVCFLLPNKVRKIYIGIDCPYIDLLFGTFSEKKTKKPVSAEQGKRLASELGAVCYVECSALTQEGMKNVFDEVNYKTRNIFCYLWTTS